MGLETANYIAGLVDTNPDGDTDFLNQGDDHIRMLKVVLKQQFPGAGGNGLATVVIATEAELNYLEGVRMNIQTQLDSITNRLDALEN